MILLINFGVNYAHIMRSAMVVCSLIKLFSYGVFTILLVGSLCFVLLHDWCRLMHYESRHAYCPVCPNKLWEKTVLRVPAYVVIVVTIIWYFFTT